MKDITRGVAICGFTGVNGAGKTLAAVTCCILKMIGGREVYSTVPIRYVDKKGRVYESKPIVSLRQLLNLRDCTVLLDDVATIFSSRTSASLPHEVTVLLQTLRHRGKTGVDVIWTAPAWMACDNQLRRVTRGVVNVSPLLTKSDPNSPWGRARFAMYGLMDTTQGKIDEVPKKVLRRALTRTASVLGFGSYDTHADTPLIGGHFMTGTCADCGGSIQRPKHSRELHEALGLPWYDDDGIAETLRESRTPRFVEQDLVGAGVADEG